MLAPSYKIGGILAAAILVGSVSLCPAFAAQPECLSDGTTEGFDIVPIEGATRAEPMQQATNTWEDWLWQGDDYVCNEKAKACEYNWKATKTTIVTITIGTALNLGNNNSPVGHWFNYAQSIIPSFSHTTEFSSTFDRNVLLKPGQTAHPIQIATRRWRSGQYRGGYFKLDNGESCEQGTGHWYWKSPDRTWGSWSDNVLVNTWATYWIDGKITEPIT